MSEGYIQLPITGGISSINGDSTPAQEIVGGTDINVSTSGGTTTITYTGSVTSGANVTLSNLMSPTAINEDLLPDTTNTINIGNSSSSFATGTFGTSLTSPLILGGTAANDSLDFEATSNGTYGQISFYNLNGFQVTPSQITSTIPLPNALSAYSVFSSAGPESGTTSEIGLGIVHTTADTAVTAAIANATYLIYPASSVDYVYIQGAGAIADYNSAYTGMGTTIGTLGESFSSGTGSAIAYALGNFGAFNEASPVYSGSSTGLGIGAFSLANGYAVNIGQLGYTEAETGQTSVGSMGVAITESSVGNNIGGYFLLTDADILTLPASANVSAALVADNGTTGSDLFQLYNNSVLSLRVFASGTTATIQGSGTGPLLLSSTSNGTKSFVGPVDTSILAAGGNVVAGLAAYTTAGNYPPAQLYISNLSNDSTASDNSGLLEIWGGSLAFALGGTGGTYNAPGYLTSGQHSATLYFTTWGGQTPNDQNLGTIGVRATQNHNASAFGSEFVITSTANGSTSDVETAIFAGDVVTLGPSGAMGQHVLNTATATAASGVGTFTNLPAGYSGNPTGYVQITINGATHVIPYW